PAETLKLAKWLLASDVVVRGTGIPRGSRSETAPSSLSRPSQPGIDAGSGGLGNPTSVPSSALGVPDSTLETSPAHLGAAPQSTESPPTCLLEACLHAIERVPAEGRGKAAQFIPIRFILFNKLTKDDKLLLAYDAFVLGQVLGRDIAVGKLIHGDDHATLKVKALALTGEVRKRLEKIAALLSSSGAPDLVLNRHCAECEFQARCRKIAVEKDDLSLLATMSAKERQKLRSKGIFTVTQLSYTFRPRRRPKRLRGKREKYHHSLKALAIREKKIHVVGSPELKIEGTPVYLDVEGLPDRDFYYLIGLRIGTGESAVQHSLWADTVEDEGKIWREFLRILETVHKPVLIHYGSFETEFLKTMSARYDRSGDSSSIAVILEQSINQASTIFGRIYFPTLSNGLKEIATWIGFSWSIPEASGTHAIKWRHEWEHSHQDLTKKRLSTYNADDCLALETLTQVIQQFFARLPSKQNAAPPVVNVDKMIPEKRTKWQVFKSSLHEFEEVNQAAQWDYQRDRVYIRSEPNLKRSKPRTRPRPKRTPRIDKAQIIPPPAVCPKCGQSLMERGSVKTRTLFDLIWGRNSVRLRLVRYEFCTGWCGSCKKEFRMEGPFQLCRKYGWNLFAYLIYHAIHLRIHLASLSTSVERLFGARLTAATLVEMKNRAASYYQDTVDQILARIVHGPLVQVDETTVKIQSQTAYVWVFTTLEHVTYIYAETREAEVLHATLKGFKGVLISDFYSAYDSVSCPQQKCLIHLIRDLNDEILNHSFDNELKGRVKSFAELIRPIIGTVDQFGLKKHFLHKHQRFVDRFYKNLARADYQSEAALGCKQRFEKNRDKLFTFLDYDGVPWNNSNAEHAIKAVARMRDLVKGSSTACGMKDYLVLLSVCETCEYMGIDFLDFLRSGEKDIHAFAESRHGRRRRTQTSQPIGLPLDATPDTGNQP
ncbi:MAG: IS66 family transposase, partial [Verrucomicrobia bacterium]|nr:IS66 family transposase [Verrucomicrobiota bacterium]